MTNRTSERTGGLGPGAWALIALAVGALLMACWPLVGGAASPSAPGWTMGGMMMGGMGGMMLGMALVWIAVVLGLVALVRWAVGTATRGGEPDALETARRRYARGEIDREQFERLRDDLTR